LWAPGRDHAGMTHLTPDLLAFVEEWLPPPPARVLEVGCGDGAVTRHLIGAGYEVLGIDPAAPEGPAFACTTLEAFGTDAPFEAAVALRSLHHVGDLRAAVDSLVRALRPGARVVVFEFAAERLDARARGWLVEQELESHAHGEPPDVIPVVQVMDALSARFRLVSENWGGYLAREQGREDLHEAEERAIAAGELQAIGARLVYELVG
jgi:ubiquinone/menaquinone biosynthesis C-methylase UbiE